MKMVFYFRKKWGLGIGDWRLGIGDWAQSPIPNPQSPIPNPQSPFHFYINCLNFIKQKNYLFIYFIYIKNVSRNKKE